MAKKKKEEVELGKKEFDFAAFGGTAAHVVGADPKDPESRVWNFGVSGYPGCNGPVIASSAPALYSAAPHVQGMWDGKTTICCHDAAVKVLGKHLPAQYQVRGTCGGRTAKRASQLLQSIMIAAGRAAKFKDVSHAWAYAAARAEYGMRGSGENSDGVPDGSIPPILAKYGLLSCDESGDTNFYGAGSDDLAVKWGSDRSNIPDEFWGLASDNKVEANLVKVRTFQEMADGFAAGGVGLVSSNRGFTMTRDKNGICRPSGTWGHYMTGSGIVMVDSRAFGAIDQSWGRNVPDGPTIGDGRWPDFSFAADRDAIERDMIQNGSWHMIFGFPLWDEEALIDWRKI